MFNIFEKRKNKLSIDISHSLRCYLKKFKIAASAALKHYTQKKFFVVQDMQNSLKLTDTIFAY